MLKNNWFIDSSSPIMEGIVDLHNYIFFYMVIVVVFVLYLILTIAYYFFWKNTQVSMENIVWRYTLFSANKVSHGSAIEIIWTLIPSVILMAIAIPSFALLYSMDEVILPSLVIKVIGYQWYWAYEYSKSVCFDEHEAFLLEDVKFSSYILPETDLRNGQFRLLEVDKPLLLPINTHIRALVTANDVLHSWAIPALGIKIDAVPGRLNSVNFIIKRPGTFYGQCREICGVSHGYMPIRIDACDF